MNSNIVPTSHFITDKMRRMHLAAASLQSLVLVAYLSLQRHATLLRRCIGRADPLNHGQLISSSQEKRRIRDITERKEVALSGMSIRYERIPTFVSRLLLLSTGLAFPSSVTVLCFYQTTTSNHPVSSNRVSSFLYATQSWVPHMVGALFETFPKGL